MQIFCTRLQGDQPIDKSHRRSCRHAEHNNGSRDDKHLCRRTVYKPFRLKFHSGRCDGICKTRDRDNATRSRILADTIVYAKARQQHAEENKRDGDRARKDISRKPCKFEHHTEKLPDTADESAHKKCTHARLEMLRRRRKRMHIIDVILVIIFVRTSRHGRISSLPTSGKQVSRSSLVLPSGLERIFLISLFWKFRERFIQGKCFFAQTLNK